MNRLGRTIARWATQITNWNNSAVTNGPTEGLNNLIKRIKRTAFGFRTRVWRVVWCFTRSGGIREEGVSTTFGV
ncbi:MAG: transposase [Acidimicrobiia bacterium]|nr:transposase [Acidimicrobiia bacterium]